MKILIKQNCYSGYWWIKPACPRSRLVLRADHNDNGALSNDRMVLIVGREWLRDFMHGIHDATAWHEVEVPVNDSINQRATAALNDGAKLGDS